MKFRPILFSGPMVRALLDGSKTQTRRVVKPQFATDAIPCEMGATNERGHQISGHSGMWWCDAEGNHEKAVRCPYGQPGDRLWVREAWRIGAWREDDGEFAIDFCDGPDKSWRKTPATYEGEELFNRLWIQSCDELHKKGIEPDTDGVHKWDAGASPLRWRPSIHMPRWASRITLEVTGVRVERLQDISKEDAAEEGIQEIVDAGVNHDGTPRDAYRALWESINGPGSWEANPWVWVVEFKRIEGGVA